MSVAAAQRQVGAQPRLPTSSGHIYRPLAALFPARSPRELSVTARSLFSAVHGMVALGLEHKLIAVPIEALRSEVATIVRAMVEGLKAANL